MFLGLQARLMAGLIVLVCFTLAIVAYSLLQDSHRQLEKFQLTQARYQAQTLAEGSLDALVTHDGKPQFGRASVAIKQHKAI